MTSIGTFLIYLRYFSHPLLHTNLSKQSTQGQISPSILFGRPQKSLIPPHPLHAFSLKIY